MRTIISWNNLPREEVNSQYGALLRVSGQDARPPILECAFAKKGSTR